MTLSCHCEKRSDEAIQQPVCRPTLDPSRVLRVVGVSRTLSRRIAVARDAGLEETLAGDLDGVEGLSTKPMFGGLAYLLNGNLLCGARQDGLMMRLGKGNDGWALAIPGIVSLHGGSSPMPGWVRVGAELCGDDALRRRLLDAALAFTGALPPK
jgi:hypothetical protein